MIPRLYFLKEDEQLLVESFTRRFTVKGPQMYFATPFDSVVRRKGITMGPTDYVLVRNVMTGELRNEHGPQIYFLSAQEEVVRHLRALPLRLHEYVRIIDSQTGSIRVERGEQSVMLLPTEEVLGQVQEAIDVDEHTAVLLRDQRSGEMRLVREQQAFVPRAEDEILEVRKKLLLEDYETVVVKDKDGNYVFKRGTDPDNSFFLGPYEELVTLRWSAGIHKNQRTLLIQRFDTRPKFMWFEFEARTQDNVELVIGITFFWQIVDIEAMFRTTDDTPGDVCSHARSCIIQAISRKSLEAFLDSFNTVVRDAVLDPADSFYSERGVLVKAVEVRSVTCKNPETQRILQEIIQETTNRMNRLQKQESENEVRLRKVHGEIEAEKAREELLKIQDKNLRAVGQTEGEAEAEKLRSFFQGLGDGFSLEEKMRLFQVLKKNEVLGKLSEGKANIYFTPADVDLSIETREA